MFPFELVKPMSDPVLFLGLTAFYILLISLPFSFWAVGGNKSSPWVRWLVALANLLLTAQLVWRWLQSGHFPISNLYESLCFLAWACTMTQLLVERSLPSPIVSAVTTPLSLTSIAFASFALPDTLQESSPLVPALRSSWLVMHVSVIMCSYACLLIGSLLSVAVLIFDTSQDLQIRSNSIGIGGTRSNLNDNLSNLNRDNDLNLSSIVFNRIESLDTLSYRVISVGFLLLTVGLVSGSVWANEAWGSWWSWDPKETWALISWLVYAAYLHSRLTKGWQGRKPASIALLGLLVIVICYIGVNLLGLGLHSYGWFF